MTLLPPDFPDESLPLVTEFRSRVKRLLGKPGKTAADIYPLTSNILLWWWEKDNEIGIANFSTDFDPILRTTSVNGTSPQVIEWGTLAEVQEMMDRLRTRMVLDDLADV